MRYVVAIGAAGLVGLFFHYVFGLGSLPRPWGSLGLGTVAGLTIVIFLYIWEVKRPSEDPDERDKRLRIEEAAKDEARELRRAQKRNGTWNQPIDDQLINLAEPDKPIDSAEPDKPINSAEPDKPTDDEGRGPKLA